MPKTTKTRCTICLENVRNRVKLPCKHKFCYKCIKENQKYNNKCPNCRETYYKYRHKKKTKSVDMSEDFKNYIATLTTNYITDIYYRYSIDIMYLKNISNKFRIIETTINILLDSNSISDRNVLEEIKEHMDYINSINI